MSEWVTLTRKRLFKEVWTTPISKLCTKYGLSDVGLAKICKRNNIPKPPKGYWAKIHAGQKPQKTKLPSGHTKNKTIRIHVKSREEQYLSSEIKTVIDNISNSSIRIESDLRKAHYLVKQTNNNFKISPTQPQGDSCASEL